MAPLITQNTIIWSGCMGYVVKKITNWRLWSLFYKMVNYDLQRNANNVVFGRVYVLMNRIEIVSERRMVRGLKAKV